MTTQNHGALALTAALLAADASPTIKGLVLVGLVLSHIPADAIPHWHFYDFKVIRETGKGKLGALIELGGGLFILPILFWLLTGMGWGWLGWIALCVFAASLFDFSVAFEQIIKIKLGIIWLNHKLHWWDKRKKETPEKRKISEDSMVTWETIQTIIVFGIMLYFVTTPSWAWIIF